MRAKKILASLEEPASLQLHPLKYPWAWDLYLKMLDNNWHPREIPMASDIAVWRRGQMPPLLSAAFLTVFSQLTAFDFQRAVDIGEVLLPLVQAPEIKRALIRQMAQEALHTCSYQYCIENLGLDQDDICSRWERVPILNRRVRFADGISQRMLRHAEGARSGNPAAIAQVTSGIVFWFLGFEGVWFVLNLLGPVQAMARHNFMLATAEQFQYIARDETTHISLGTFLVNALIKEALDEESLALLCSLVEKDFLSVLSLEAEFIEEAFPSPWLGYPKQSHVEMAKWLINKRMESIGFLPPHDVPSCPIPWLTEMLDLRNRTGGSLSWDE